MTAPERALHLENESDPAQHRAGTADGAGLAPVCLVACLRFSGTASLGGLMATGDASLLIDPVAKELLSSRIPAHLSYVWSDGSPRVDRKSTRLNSSHMSISY